MSKFIDKLKNNKFIKSVLVLSSGSLIAQILGVITTPIVSRLYSLEAYGVYGVIASISSIVGSMTTIGLSSAIMACKTEDECKDTFMVSMYTTIFLNLIITIVLAFIMEYSTIINSGLDTIITSLFIFFISTFTNISGLLIVYANKLSRNRTLFVNSLVTAFATLVITIPLGYANVDLYGMLIASLIANLINVLHMSIVIKPYKRINLKETFIRVYKMHKDYVLYQYPSNILEVGSQQIANPMLSSGFGNASLGSFTMSEKILGIPARLLAAPIGQVYFRTATQYQEEEKDIAGFTYKMLVLLIACSLLPVLVTIFWGSEIFTFVLGENWGQAGDMAGLLIIFYVFQFCTICVSYCRVVIGKQKVNLLMSFVELMFIITSLVVGIFGTQVLTKTLFIFSIAMSIFEVIDLTITMKCLKGKYWIYFLIISTIYLVFTYGMWFLSKTI